MKAQHSQSAVVVAFNAYDIESHVLEAFHKAWLFSEGQPLNAGHLLKGALIVAGTVQSPAFRDFASLASISGLAEPERSAVSGVQPLDLAAAAVVRPLAESFSISEAYLSEGGVIWGRDFITMALLAKSDPSLGQFAKDAGVDIGAVRVHWLNFLQSSDRRREPESWHRWYRSAGAGPLGDKVPSDTARHAYLFTWNPDQFEFPKLELHVKEIKKEGSTKLRWSTGNRKNISVGDRVFLLRQGVRPRGLIGVGTVASEVLEKPHWDKAKADRGLVSRLADVEFLALSREPLIDRSQLIEQTDETALWSSAAGGVEIPAEIAHMLEESWPDAWERRLRGLEDDHLPNLPPRKLIALLDSDTGGRIDSLRIDRYVDAFARVMASRSLTPPLSIGLFGDWGSGKSFFMERLEQGIDRLVEEDDSQSPLYWQNICQIRFNAWHYAETDLWASMVSTIFNRLRVYLDGEHDDSDEFNKLLQRLELAGELRKEAENHLSDVQQQLEDTQRNVDDAEKALSKLPAPPQPSDEKVREILSKSIGEALPKSPQEIAELLDSAAEWSGRDDFREAAKLVREGKQTVEQAETLLEETRALSSRAGFWWRVLSTAKLYRTPSFWIVIAILLAIPAGLMVIRSSFPQHDNWAQTWGIFAEVLTAFGAAIAWVRSRLAKAGPVFDRLDSLRLTIEKKIETARNLDRGQYETDLASAQAEEARVRHKLEVEQKKLSDAREAERVARLALEQSTSTARLGRFIRERASTADYEKHLGLIAMIHRDFRRLSDLMQGAQTAENDPELPRVDRIILYIDDLDRCHPPKRVVRVLEAVHLLLFFPLFVVVVGVDSRWVSRALFKHYEEMLADESITTNGANDGGRRPPADSQDFLEKIFQVPFWLRRMDPGAVKRMIHNIISEHELVPNAPDEEQLLDSDDDTMSDPALSATETASGQTQTNAPAEGDRGRKAAKRVTTEAESDALTIGEPLAAPTEALTISQAELDFMDKVAPVMPRTPRSVKRFVNIYRLYKAALSTTGLARFLGTRERPGNFRAVQVLLALVTGAPQIAKSVFDQLHAGESGGFEQLVDLVNSMSEVDDESWQTTVEALRQFALEQGDLSYEDLKAVSHLVSRYSVHHMVSSAPGQTDLD